MTAPKINTYLNTYTIGRGRPFFNQLVEGVYQGFRPFGNSPECSVNVTTDKFEHESSEGGIGEVDFTQPIKITRKGKVTCDNFSDDNLQLFLSAELASVAQTSTPVTDEAIPGVVANRSYQLGATTSNPAGVRGVGSVVVRVANGANASSRANTTAYAIGDVYVPATPNTHWYRATVAGTSAGSPPTFTTDGTTFADGTATFKDMGLIIVASTAGVNYIVDTDLGLLSITPTGTIAAAVTAAGAGVINLEVDYTPVAQSRSQIRTTSTAKLEGQFKFIADNPAGANRDMFLPSVSLSPSGDLSLISANNLGSMTFEIGINKLDSNTSAIYIDGRPV